MKTVDRDTLEQLASRVAGGLGYDVVDLEWKHEAGRWVLRVFIDFSEATLSAPSGMPAAASPDSTGSAGSREQAPDPRLVSLNDCSHLSRVLSAELDVSELISVPFTLEVSSPGVNRPLRRESDFRRFAGQKAKIRTRQGIATGATEAAPRRNFAGRLLGAALGPQGPVIQIDVDGQVYDIPLDDVEKANLQYEF